ncbi:EamA family transporter [Acinetobacter junii]|jgi:drug/metabolite transporter (DMT)-like permease|uniref:DMT family transporter n=1 Tax=Acinetobacter junii TaxID=40215 RepID=UPI00057B471F|nr:EamA family transporter [Acinetobacter junii]MDH0667760.1 EamA family transporter [Acinetobacter junii]MDH1689517.1 EamA family transporter [Acinetobacter junii]MEB8380557.1 EamA family transporter [Acinetobacter junii]QUS49169.1 EamA family transporter [Acinetobacter junii]QXR11584.1 EamA family transporter [Acinetobacter junii]
MPSRTNLILTYGLLVFIWATTPLAIVWSVSDLHPMWALVLRFFIALPLAIVVLFILKVRFPVDKVSILSYIAGSLSLIGSQIFTYAATAYLSSGLIALMFGLAPIMAGLIGRFGFQQKLALLQWLGMAVSIIGLGLICLSDNQNHVQPLGIGLMIVSVFAYSLSIFLVKKINANIQAMAQATGSILVSTLIAILVVPWIWQYVPTQMPSAKSLLALFYTVIMASLIAMFCYFKLVQNLKPTTLSLTTVMTPLLAILIGAFLNDEQLSVQVFVGASIVLFGLLLYFLKDLRAYRRI